MFEKYYLAYGSNLNISQMKFRCPNAIPIGTMILKDHRLVYKGQMKGYSYLTIEKSKGDIVPLGLYKVTYSDILSLDIYEGYPTSYSKYYLPFKMDGKNHKALIYIMNKDFSYHSPSTSYIETCTIGYEDFGFDKGILEKALSDTKNNIAKRKIIKPRKPKK